MDNLAHDIGAKIRDIRKSMGLSLDAAAKLTGVSKAMLGQIERGESIPTVQTLWKISSGLKVTFSNFVTMPKSDSAMVRIADIPPVSEEDGKMLAYNVFNFDPITGFDYLEIVLEPGCRHESLPHTNVLNEYVVVTEGCLEMIVNNESTLIEKGCAFFFSGNSVHTYVNPTNERTVFQCIMRYM